MDELLVSIGIVSEPFLWGYAIREI